MTFGHHGWHGRGGRWGSRWGGNWADILQAFGAEFQNGNVRFDVRGRGRSRRVLTSGELQLILLSLIEAEPLHGYAMIEAIETRTGGAYAPSPGVVYPTLTLLADMELAEERPDGARKTYAITDKGRAHLDERREELGALLDRLDAAGGKRERPESAPVWRAMFNLGSVLKGRVWEAKADRDTILAIAEIIDDAARKIERL
jgi:DNA-binding PadR family transcriptional regulator